jgi:hypothetical protein
MSAGMLLLFVPFLLIQFLPHDFLLSIVGLLQRTDPLRAALLVVFLLLVADAALLLAGMRLFRRSRLILD